LPKIISVDKNSPAFKVGIKSGYDLISIEGENIVDVMDYKFYSYEKNVSVKCLLPDGESREYSIKKKEGEDLGLNFETYLIDNPRHCKNKCIFCFIDQLPRGMRDTLYFKDDDARLSFFSGNYISMTNLTDADVDRITKMHITPLNISVHTTNPELRVKMLTNPNAGTALKYMKKLADGGITMNCQIVLCPDVNDKEELVKTLADLSALYPAVQSISVVPVGITKHREGLYPLRPLTINEAVETLDIVEKQYENNMNKYSLGMVYCGDEIYLKAGREIPDHEYYEGFPQIENGVGMISMFEDEFTIFEEDYIDCEFKPFTAVSGYAAADYISKKISTVCKKGEYNLYKIKNDFFGHEITVSGLITGQDIINQLKGKKIFDRLLIPNVMLKRDEEVFLDNITPSDIERELKVKVECFEPSASGMLQAIFGF